MKCVFICFFIPFASFGQSKLEQSLFGTWELSQNNQLTRVNSFGRNKFTIEFKEKGVFRYTYFKPECIQIYSKIIETKWIIKDSVLTFQLLINSKLDTINVRVKKVTHEYLFLE